MRLKKTMNISQCRKWLSKMSKLTDLTLAEARDGLAKKEFSATELTQAHIDRVAASDALNA